ERPWRRSGSYPQETRLFYEVLVFAIVVENTELFHQIMGIFSEIGSLFGGNLNGAVVSLLGVFSGFFYEPIQMAILVLALGGLVRRQRAAPSALEQTPGPASLLILMMGIPIAAICAYLLAESMLWSNFLYWILAR